MPRLRLPVKACNVVINVSQPARYDRLAQLRAANKELDAVDDTGDLLQVVPVLVVLEGAKVV